MTASWGNLKPEDLHPEMDSASSKPGPGPEFEARFYGRCAGCGEKIIPGDQVFYEDDELYAADCCGD